MKAPPLSIVSAVKMKPSSFGRAVWSIQFTSSISNSSRSRPRNERGTGGNIYSPSTGHDYVRQGRHNQLADLSGPMLGACLPLAERDRGVHPCGSPVWGLPVGLTLFENPVSRLC